MRPSRGYVSLVSPRSFFLLLSVCFLIDSAVFRLQGMMDVRTSESPVPEDVVQRNLNRFHAEQKKKEKDAREKKRLEKVCLRDQLVKHRQEQRREGLSEESSPS